MSSMTIKADPTRGVLCTWSAPDGVIRSQEELTPEGVEELKARFLAAQKHGRIELSPEPALFLQVRPCPECGHSGLVHVGTDHCPVCELIWQTTRLWRQQQVRINGGR